MIEPDKESIGRALWEKIEEYKGLPLTPELREELSSKVMEILTPVSPSTVEVIHSPIKDDPLKIEITIGLGIDCLPRLLDL